MLLSVVCSDYWGFRVLLVTTGKTKSYSGGQVDVQYYEHVASSYANVLLWMSEMPKNSSLMISKRYCDVL